MTPSEFYRELRPEAFSDSEIISESNLQKEVLAYELSTISTNQKQDDFETLCRRLAEKFIAPNLIPQVGPTGGGDGKTDSETYPVSEDISDRWFTPENGWNKDENWAFAISAKEAWKGKAKGDVKKIVETKRGYTRVYFMSNQLISSKKKKDAQDEFIKEFEIDVVILDGEWVLEKIYGNNLINLVVDALNLSNSFKSTTRLGSNDTARVKELEELEEKINNPVMYSEYDFQKVEDALDSAILSRMLEKSRDEVEGKFDRALRFARKLKNTRQLMRVYYQRAWTFINWYDDYSSFVEEYRQLKQLITDKPTIPEIENYCTLFTILFSLQQINNIDFEGLGINIQKEKNDIYMLLEKVKNDNEKPTTSLFAKTQIVTLNLVYQEKSIVELCTELIKILELAKNKLDYPFEILHKMIEEGFSKLYPDSEELDEVIDLLADISADRSSDIESGIIFLNRAIQKLKSKYYKESIVYFGKALLRMAKEETSEYLYFVLLGLGTAYREIGLIWASNNSYISACQFAFKDTDIKGIPSNKIYNITKELLINELFIGRIPLILTWHEMLLIFYKSLNIEEDKGDIPFIALCDGTLSTRIIHTQNTNDLMKFLPDMLTKQELHLSQDSALYKQGYTEICIKERKDISTEEELNSFYKMVANQPFVEQMMYDTDFMVDEHLSIFSNLLGCKFQVKFQKDKEMLLIAETLLSFLESFMGTSLSNVHPHREKIIINFIKTDKKSYFKYDDEDLIYNLYIDSFDKNNFQEYWEIFMQLSSDIIGRNFLIDDYEKHFLKIFEKEEVHKRLSLILNHQNNIYNILGDNPKVFFNDWIKYYKPNEYPYKRKKDIHFEYKKTTKPNFSKYTKKDLEDISHNKIKTYSVIDMSLWDKAKWRGVGFVLHPQDGLYMLLAFDNIEYGKKIFEKWLKEFGYTDKEDVISITIIKGINKKEPYSYKIMISTNGKLIKSTTSEGIAQILIRFHKMDAKTPENLNNLIVGFQHFKKYKLIPASMNDKDGVKPIFDKAITKASLVIKDAWEIGIHDLERSVIQKDDNPIIPKEHENDAPILSVLASIK